MAKAVMYSKKIIIYLGIKLKFFFKIKKKIMENLPGLSYDVALSDGIHCAVFKRREYFVYTSKGGIKFFSRNDRCIVERVEYPTLVDSKTLSKDIKKEEFTVEFVRQLELILEKEEEVKKVQEQEPIRGFFKKKEYVDPETEYYIQLPIVYVKDETDYNKEICDSFSIHDTEENIIKKISEKWAVLTVQMDEFEEKRRAQDIECEEILEKEGYKKYMVKNPKYKK
jgi:hypothetical protein